MKPFMKPSEIVKDISSQLCHALRSNDFSPNDAARWAFLLQDIVPEIEVMEARTGLCPTDVASHGDNIVLFRPRFSGSGVAQSGEGSP